MIIKTKGRIRSIIYLIVLFSCTFAYAMVQGGFASWFLFYSLCPVEVYWLLFLFYPLNDFHIERSFSQSAVAVDEQITITMTIQRKWPFPFFYCVIFDHVHHPTYSSQLQKQLLFPWFKRTFSFTYSATFKERGLYTFDAVTCMISDGFGIMKKTVVYSITSECVVYPLPLRGGGLPSFYKGDGQMEQVSFGARDLSMVVGTRDYVPGDRLNMIDFKASAKTNQWKSKEFEIEREGKAVIILDQTIPPGDAFERAVRLMTGLVMSESEKHAQTCIVNEKLITLEARQIQALFYELAVAGSLDETTFFQTIMQLLRKERMTGPLIFITHTLTKRHIEWFKLMKQTGALFVYFVGQEREFTKNKLHYEFYSLNIPWRMVEIEKEGVR